MPRNDELLLGHTDDRTCLRFACSGIRELKLWAAVDDRVQGNSVLGKSDNMLRKLMDITLWTDFRPVPEFRQGSDEVLDYAVWLEICKAD